MIYYASVADHGHTLTLGTHLPELHVLLHQKHFGNHVRRQDVEVAYNRACRLDDVAGQHVHTDAKTVLQHVYGEDCLILILCHADDATHRLGVAVNRDGNRGTARAVHNTILPRARVCCVDNRQAVRQVTEVGRLLHVRGTNK